MLERDQQEEVLAYIKSLLTKEEMNRRAALSEKEIAAGRTISSEQFKSDFEGWKKQKRASTK